MIHNSYSGIGATQQQAASTVGSALLSSAVYAGPVAGAALAVAGSIAEIVSLFGPNPNNTYATEIVNQVEADVMQPNLHGWQALPPDEKTSNNQAAFEQNFYNGWNYVLQSCNNPQLGSAGINCIGDRQRGGKFDWFASYLDPIANDPQVAINTAAALAASTNASNTTSTDGSGTSSISSIVSGIDPNMLILGGMMLAGLWALSEL
jgi:hypothetical protein